MNKIERVFRDGKAFIPFITAGDPSLEFTEELVISLAEAGADIVELGVPFSDPVCEGAIVQRADERALAAGYRTDRLFESLVRIRERTDVPLLLLTYLNPVFVYGADKFLKNCSEARVDGIVVLDMPFDEKDEISAECKKHGITLISIAAATSKHRVQLIAQESDGFLYFISPLAVSGRYSELLETFAGMVGYSKEISNIPCAISYEISTPEEARELSGICDGLITGTAIIEYIEKYGDKCIGPIQSYVREMKSAIAGGGIDKLTVNK